MKYLVILLIILQVSFISCKRDDDVITKKDPGFFVLNELKGSLKEANPNILKTTQSDFYLGELKASMQYAFILANGGNEPIFDIELSTDNPAFTISPESISILEAYTQFDNTSSSGIIPIISLGIIHGNQINGIGFTDLLPMNTNTAMLTITGKTMDGNDTITISSDFHFTVNAKVMDIKLYVDNIEFDITSNYGGSSTTLGGLGFIRFYQVNASSLEIENSGNVDIDLTYGSDNMLLKPNNKKQIDMADCLIFRLNGNGTITDNSRIQLGNDGIGYFEICNQVIPPSDSLP